MTIPNDRGNSGNTEVHRADPQDAATDPNAAAQQDQVRADHDALQESARRVEASVPADVRNTPIQQADSGNTGSTARSSSQQATTDPSAAARMDQVKADHDALQESGRRVEASVPADVRNTPVQPANLVASATEDTAGATRNADAARENADAARDSTRRVEESVPEGQDRDRR